MLGSTGSNGSTPLQRVRAAFPRAEAVGELVAAGYASVLDTVAALVWCALLHVLETIAALVWCALLQVLDTVAALVWCALLQAVVRRQSAPACWTARHPCPMSCKPDGSWDEHSAGGSRYASVLDMVVIIVTASVQCPASVGMGVWDGHSAGGTRYASVLDMAVIIVTSANASYAV